LDSNARSYDVFGELTSQIDAKSQSTTMAYDALGRLNSRTESEGTTSWTYDTATNGKGKLAAVSAPGSYSETYSYDTLSRPIAVSRTIDATPYSISQTYDSVGRPSTTVYPTGFQTNNVYSSFGAIKEVRRADSGLNDLYWQADSYAVDGRVNGETYGNGLTNDRVYSQATGRLLAAAVGLAPTNGIQYLTYSYDQIGNVLSRADGPTGRSETFVYDTLDRLTSDALSGGSTVTVSYSANGNIKNKSDVGNYTYGATAGPHALTGVSGGSLGTQTYTYDLNGNMSAGGGRSLIWTSFNQVLSVSDQSGHFSTFSFGAGHERVKQVANNGTTLYVGGIWEKFTNGGGTTEKNYIMAPTGRVAVATFGTGVPVQGTLSYFHTDGLGSITAVTDATGNVVQRFAFDAWGKRINPATGATITSSTNGNFTRGYTDHEQLDDLGLIHMNGRVYDPVLGRFLSADPNIDGVYDSQGYNRYSYCGNNPMNRSDPSGYFSFKEAIVIVIAVVVTAIVTFYTAGGGTLSTWAAFSGVISNAGLGAVVAGGAAGGFAAGFSGSLLNGGSLGDAFRAGVIGGITGAASAAAAFGIGQMFDQLGGGTDFFSSKAANWGGRALAHGVAQGAITEASGGQFRHGFYAGAAASAASPLINRIQGNSPSAICGRIAVAAVVGGTASVLGGGKFANGAMSGAFIQMFNAEMAKMLRKSDYAPDLAFYDLEDANMRRAAQHYAGAENSVGVSGEDGIRQYFSEHPDAVYDHIAFFTHSASGDSVGFVVPGKHYLSTISSESGIWKEVGLHSRGLLSFATACDLGGTDTGRSYVEVVAKQSGLTVRAATSDVQFWDGGGWISRKDGAAWEWYTSGKK
jgi:RHS repeat-associated protein